MSPHVPLPVQVHSNGLCLDDEILADSEVQDAIKNEGKVHRKLKIVNTDRATLGRIGGAIAKVHGDSGFAGEISVDFEVLLCLFACKACLQSVSIAQSASLSMQQTAPPLLSAEQWDTASLMLHCALQSFALLCSLHIWQCISELCQLMHSANAKMSVHPFSDFGICT